MRLRPAPARTIVRLGMLTACLTAATTGVAAVARAAEPVHCPDDDVVPPPDAGDLTGLDADLDGDGARERVQLWSQADETGTVWRVSATGLGAGAAAQLDVMPGDTPELLAAADADGRGADEVFIAHGHGAYMAISGLWGLHDCTLAPVTVAPVGERLGFVIGASARHRGGVACTRGAAPRLSVWSAESDPEGALFTVVSIEYSWSPDVPLQVRQELTTVATVPAAAMMVDAPACDVRVARETPAGPTRALPPVSAVRATPAYTG